MLISWLVARITKSTRIWTWIGRRPWIRRRGRSRSCASSRSACRSSAPCRTSQASTLGGAARSTTRSARRCRTTKTRAVALHLLRRRLADGAGVIKLSHGTHLRAAGRASGSAPATLSSRLPGWPCRSRLRSPRWRFGIWLGHQLAALHLEGVAVDPFALDRRLVAVASVPVGADADMLEVATAP